MRFQSPFWFFLLLPWFALVYWRVRRRLRTGVIFSDVTVPKHAPRSLFSYVKPLVAILPYAALLLLIVALARPQSGREEFRTEVEGIAILMCIDRSGSMQARDFHLFGRRITRLEAVKKTFRDFVLGTEQLPGRPNDKIGLIAFGGFVDSFCPLTLDHATLMEMLENVQLVEMPKDALGQDVGASFINEERLTAIGDALVEATARLKDVEAKSKVIVLLSDGEQTAGIATPYEGALAAKAYGIKIYTIGIGEMGSALFLEKNRYGDEVVTHQPVTLDQGTLSMIAQQTGGAFFSAKDTKALEEVYAQIDQLEKTSMEGRVYTKYNEHYRSALLPAIALLLLYSLLISTRFQTLPE